MPVGTSWPRYIAAMAGAVLSMLAGAQVVHLLYHPLEDLDSKIEQEKKDLLKTMNAEEAAAVSATSASSNSSVG